MSARRGRAWAGSLAFHAGLLVFLPALLLIGRGAASEPSGMIVRHHRGAARVEARASLCDPDEARIEIPTCDPWPDVEFCDDLWFPPLTFPCDVCNQDP